MGTEIMKYFPLESPPRSSQVTALDFIERMVKEYEAQDIVIEAPTGAGKSAIGAACCHWAADWTPRDMGEGVIAKPGGYYLVAQLLLQDQITKDVAENFRLHDFASLKSSSNYTCDGGNTTHKQREILGFEAEEQPFISCQMGMLDKTPKCYGRKNKTCPYIYAKNAYESSIFSLTNYPWFLTERMFLGKLQPRNVIILDEAHGLERQLLRFGEVELNDQLLRDWGIRGLRVPEIDDMQTFANWLDTRYLSIIRQRLAESALEAQTLNEDDPKFGSIASRITALANQEQKIAACVTGVRAKPQNWVYWCDQTEDKGNVAYCKPLEAAPYMDLIRSGGHTRIYMSAFPGSKEVFCLSLGLDPEEVAWIKMPSDFDPKNRPVVMGLVGSMSMRNQDTTLPAMLRVVDKILVNHASEKGVIHCHSYKLGGKIFDYFQRTKHAKRFLYPKTAEARDDLYKQHVKSKVPTVLLSPSMTEGYDFKDDQARWQIIAKVPYPYLGDKQVAAKKDRSQEWYDLQTIMSIVQAAGRVCRSEKDRGVTYVLDSDFRSLWDKRRDTFPKWFRDAIVWT